MNLKKDELSEEFAIRCALRTLAWIFKRNKKNHKRHKPHKRQSAGNHMPANAESLYGRINAIGGHMREPVRRCAVQPHDA